MTKRTDVHAPSRIVPEDYDYVTVRSRGDALYSNNVAATMAFNAHREAHPGAVFSDHDHGGGCDVCGAWMLDYAIFYHRPSNRYIKTGLTCAEHIDAGHADAFRHAAKVRRAAAKRNERLEVAMVALEEAGIADIAELIFCDNDIGGAVRGCTTERPEHLRRDKEWGEPIHPDLYDSDEEERFSLSLIIGEPAYVLSMFHVRRIDGWIMTLIDIIRKLVKYGNWSPAAMNYAVSLANKINNIEVFVKRAEEEEANKKPAPEGKVEVEGEVLVTKTDDGYYGYTRKMLVKGDGWKVWSTIPAALDRENVKKGDKVKFTATLTRSDKDEAFAFAKRPSKASIVERAEAEAS